MNPYCPDLRARVISAAEAGDETQIGVATALGVSLSTVEKWLHRKRETGQSTAQLYTHGPRRTLQTCGKIIRAEIKKQPDLTLAELCERVATTHRVKASPSMMCRELQQLALPRKKDAVRQPARHAAGQAPATRICGTHRHGIQPRDPTLEIHR